MNQLLTAFASMQAAQRESERKAELAISELQERLQSVLAVKQEHDGSHQRENEPLSDDSNDDRVARAPSDYKPTRPPMFSGAQGPLRPRSWRALKLQMTSYFREMNNVGHTLTDARMVELFVQNLTDQAVINGSIIASRLSAKGPTDRLTFEKFIAKMDLIYMRRNISHLYDELFSIQQSLGEATNDYYERFSSLLSELLDGGEVTRDVAVGWFINGLIDVLKQKVTYRRNADSVLDVYGVDQPEEAVDRCFQIALAEESILLSSGRSFLLKRRAVSNLSTSSAVPFNGNNTVMNPGNSATSSRSPWRSFTPARQTSATLAGPAAPAQAQSAHQRHRLTREEVKQHWEAQTCFNCHQTGHQAKICPAKKGSFNNMSVNSFEVLSESDDGESDEVKQTMSKK